MKTFEELDVAELKIFAFDTAVEIDRRQVELSKWQEQQNTIVNRINELSALSAPVDATDKLEDSKPVKVAKKK